METMKHTHRFIGRFIVEAETPLYVGTGQSSLLKDALVQKDVNGYPMILGTSLAGVIRHQFENYNKEAADYFFGQAKGDQGGTGALLKVSAAYMMINNKRVSEGILEDLSNDHEKFNELPIRQHVRINDKGTAEENGLFDNEIVYKGVRFMFEIELKAEEDQTAHWEELLNIITGPTFRIGSGTRNGYGKLKVIKHYNSIYNLSLDEEFKAYVDFDPSLNSTIEFSDTQIEHKELRSYIIYKLELLPDSLFIFSEGFGDDDVDNKPKEEDLVLYTEDGIRFDKQTLIPATSIKGALSHRVAFHYNQRMEYFADKKNVPEGENVAVVKLFGSAASGDYNGEEPVAGKVFINDIFLSSNQVNNDKILNHVAIDRFTGGGIHGALFSEKVSSLKKDSPLIIEVIVDGQDIEETEIQAFEDSLKDIANGLLPLGGMTTKGHGMFTGNVYKNGTELFNYNSQN